MKPFQKNPFESKKENILELMKQTILGAPKGIEEEFSRTANSWFACFVSPLEALDTYLGLAQKLGQISLNEYNGLYSKIEDLKFKLHLLRHQCQDEDTDPPDEIKKDLLKDLDIFRED